MYAKFNSLARARQERLICVHTDMSMLYKYLQKKFIGKVLKYLKKITKEKTSENVVNSLRINKMNVI